MAVNTFVCHAILLVIYAWIIRVNGGDCNTAFQTTPTFKNCTYRCHCKNDTQCDQTTGDCNNGCEFGWMGPGCQYRNIAVNNFLLVRNVGSTRNASEEAYKAVDGDVNSCSRSKDEPASGNHYWRIQWNISYRIVGLVVKIHPEDIGNFTQFSVETGLNYASFDNVCYTHGDTPGTEVMEIMCNKPVWTKHLRIIHGKPNIRMRVCEVEIYGDLSVDGQAHLPSIAADDTCSRTTKETNPYWLVDFHTLYVVQSIYFYGGLPPLHPEYRYFKIVLLNDSSFETEIYNDTGLTALEYQPKVIEQVNQITARYLKIFRPVNTNVLAICEVIAFAECPMHKCGWDCTTDCYCDAETTGKYQMDGVCPHGCSGRWAGINQKCNIECSKSSWGNQCNNTCGHCNGAEACNVVTGNCEHGCIGPWYPPECKEACSDWEFGVNCSQRCEHCLTGCDKDSGLCSNGCISGWIGLYCNKSMFLNIYLKESIRITMSSVSSGLLPDYAINSFPGPRDPNTCKCCSGTLNAQLSWWRMDLRHMYPLKELHVYGVANERVNQLSGFSIYLGNGTHEQDIHAFTDSVPDEDNKGHYIIALNNRLARYVIVQRIGTLTLCNVSLIEGECATGYYGDYCEKECHCANHGSCDREKGRCQIPVCKIGWNGTSCNNECPFQTFGEGCTNECFCKHDSCTKDYGLCNGDCKTGYKGGHCNEPCTYGTFGDGCAQNCYCKNSTCTFDEGICSDGCQEGFYGIHCNEDVHGNTGVIAAVVGGCLAAFLLIVLIFVCLIRRIRINKREQHNRENYELRDHCTVISNETSVYDTIDSDTGIAKPM